MTDCARRARRLALLAATALALGATSALAQINIGPPGGDPDDGQATVCVSDNGDLTVSLTGDDCGDFVRDVIDPLTIGPAGQAIVLSASNGTAVFGNTATFNGATVFNGNAAFNGGVTYAGAISANGITSTGGLSNTGSFTNNGSVTVSNGLTAGSLRSNAGLTVVGQTSTGSLVASNGITTSSLFSTGGVTVQGFFNAQNGASLTGNVQIGNLQVFQGANFNNNRLTNVGAPTAATDAATKGYVDTTTAGASQQAAQAQATADQALANAATAQGTADTALANAATAQATADTARIEAATAQRTANTAIAKQDTQGTTVAAALGGGASYNSTTGAVSAPSYGVGTGQYNSVGAALQAANTTGLSYFHANSTKGDSAASGSNAVAIGPASTASGASSFAAGDSAVASAAGAVAIGQGAQATGANAVAIGTGATATGSVAVGVGAAAANGGAAFGDRAVATGTNAAALGPDASATAANAVAIGAGSVATVANTVSVGTAAAMRRIVNVAAGTAASDAATVGQLSATGVSVAAALGGGSTANANGTISAPSYNLSGTTFNNVGDALVNLSGRIDGVLDFAYDIRREARRGIAAATAMANAPMPSAAGRTSWAFNGATFHGEVAVGGSLAHRFDTDEPIAVTAGFAYAKGGNNTVKVGMAGEF